MGQAAIVCIAHRAPRRTQLAREPMRRFESGFTLVELLIVLTLVGLISVALVGGLRFGIRVWETGTERSVAFNDIVSAQLFLRRQLSQAIRVGDPGLGGDAPPTFSGTRDRLRFLAPSPSHAAVAGVYAHEIAYVAEEERNRLVLKSGIRPSSRQKVLGDLPFEERILLDDVASASFRYFGRRENDKERRWHQTWSEKQSLPELVSIMVTFPADDDRQWPELTIAPKIR